jgi:VWFA-related protein
MRPLFCFLIAFPLFVPAQTPEPTFRTTTSEVLLDFVVRDKHANIIRDLKPEEVQIFEDGVLQKQRYFQFINGHANAQTSSEPAPTSPSTAAAPSVIAPAAPVTINELRDMSVVSVVLGNLDPRGRELTLKAMRDFAKNDLGPNTYVGVFTLGMAGLRTVQPYTNDASQVSAAVERAVRNALSGQFTAIDSNALGYGGLGAITGKAAVTPQFAPYGGEGSGGAAAAMAATGWVQEMDEVYMGSMQYLAPLRSLVNAQAQIPGRKVMLLFSAGILVHTDTVELLQSIISAANRANISIYALDTRGITPESTLGDSRRRLQEAANSSMNMQLSRINGNSEVTADQVISSEIAETSIHSDTRANMAELAEGTGGALLPDTIDLREPIREAIESSRTHYELTYAPANTSLDGSFRKIEVRVSRPGAKVFARSGYYAVPTVNGRQVYPFEVATLKAINTRPDLHQFNFHAMTLEFRSGTVRNQFAFLFQAPTRDLTVTTDQQWAKIHVCVTALIKDEKGQVVDKISKDIPYEVPFAKKAELERGTVSFTAPFFLPPGHYTIDTASVDRQSMKASVSRAALDVEQDPGFAMSDVTVVRRVDDIQGPANTLDPLEARGGKVTPDLSDLVAPDASGNLKFYAVAYPPAPAAAAVAMKIEIWQNEKLVMRSGVSQIPLDASGAASVLASVPAAKLPAGHYEAHVSFQYKEEKLTKEVKFTLAGAS